MLLERDVLVGAAHPAIKKAKNSASLIPVTASSLTVSRAVV